MGPRGGRLAQYRKGIQLALRPTVDTEAKRKANEAELEAMDGLVAMSEQSDPKRLAVPQSDEPPTAEESMNAVVPAAPMGPVPWETKFRTGYELFERLRSLTHETQHNILTLLQTVEFANVGDGDDVPVMMVFAEFWGYNPDSNPTSKQGGNAGKQLIWFERGFNPGGSLYARNTAQGDALQVNEKNKSYFRVRVTGPIAEDDYVIVTLHFVDGQSTQQVTQEWAKKQVPDGAVFASAPGPFLNPKLKAWQGKKESVSTVDELLFPLDMNGYSINPNGGIPELTIKHTDRGKGGTKTTVYRKFFLKITLASNPNIYQTTPNFNIFARNNDGGREATADRDLPEGYRVLDPSERDPLLGAGKYGLASASGPSSGAGSSTDPIIATVVPPSSAESDPQ